MAGILLPAAISVAKFSAPVGEPTYTQIFDATMGDLGTPADGFDKSMADLGAISDALNAEMVAEAAIGSIDTALGVLDKVDLAPLDTHIGNYEAAIPVGKQVVTDASNASPPALLELPISLDFSQGIKPPPLRNTFDAGTVKLNSPVFDFLVGRREVHGDEGSTGIYSLQIVGGETAIFSVNQVDKESHAGLDQGTEWFVEINPSKVGTFLAQYNALYVGLIADALWTVTVTVVP